jgi:hypothetical protein
MDIVQERRQKQSEYNRQYQERNPEVLLELQRVAKMNETQNVYGLLDVWLI